MIGSYYVMDVVFYSLLLLSAIYFVLFIISDKKRKLLLHFIGYYMAIIAIIVVYLSALGNPKPAEVTLLNTVGIISYQINRPVNIVFFVINEKLHALKLIQVPYDQELVKELAEAQSKIKNTPGAKIYLHIKDILAKHSHGLLATLGMFGDNKGTGGIATNQKSQIDSNTGSNSNGNHYVSVTPPPAKSVAQLP